MEQEQPGRVGRRLAAIVAADVAGYSRLMGLDEVGTARTLREHREVTDALVAKHGGRLVKTTGDGVLLEFPSVVDAVECAVAVQAVMAERNEGVPQDRRMLFRIGINLGDILIEGDDILGDGVNIAARLEGIAEPGGICISSSAYDQVRGKVAVEFADLGEQTLKNIARPVRAYAVVRDANARHTQRPRRSASAPRLSIVVLPFANIGGDPEQDYFVDGVTESLTTDLSRISGAFVIARNTAFTFKGKAVDVKQDRTRAERPLCARRLGAAWRQPASGERAVDRRRNRQSPLGRALRQARRRPLRHAGRNRLEARQRARMPNSLRPRRGERSVRRIPMRWTCISKVWLGEQGNEPPNTWRKRAAFLNEPWRSIPTISRRWSAWRWSMRNWCRLRDRRPGRAPCGGRSDVDQDALPGAEPRIGALCLGVVQILTNRAAQGIAECERALALDRNLAARSRDYRSRQAFSGSRRGNREPCPGGAPPLSSRYASLCLDDVRRLRQAAARRRRGSGRVVARRSRDQPKLSARAFLSRRRAGASRSSWMRRGPQFKRGLRSIRRFTIAPLPTARQRTTYCATWRRIRDGLRKAGCRSAVVQRRPFG